MSIANLVRVCLRDRHARTCSGHPRLACWSKDVDGRVRPGHDGGDVCTAVRKASLPFIFWSLAMLQMPALAQAPKIGDPPEAKNMRLVGFNDLQGRSAYQPIGSPSAMRNALGEPSTQKL